MRVLAAIVLAVILAGSVDSATGLVETITSSGSTWTGSTWGYNTPKLICDGRTAYAVALVGSGPGDNVARLYFRNESGWHQGAAITPIYQPATILLDSSGFINLFCTEAGKRGYHWRSTSPRDVTAFEQIPLTDPEKFAFGYFGTGRYGDMLVLAGLDNQYAMWITIKPSASKPWTKPALLASSQKQQQPWTSPVYPIVIPSDKMVHVIYSNSPDGGVHNTYNRVEYAEFDTARGSVTKRDVIARGPVGEMTFGLDAVMAPDGTLYALYLTGVYVYGDKQSDIESRKGLYCSVLKPGGKWRTFHVTSDTGTAQLYRSSDGILHVLQSTSNGTINYVSTDDVRSWKKGSPEVLWQKPGSFLYVVKPNSGSVMDKKIRALQSTSPSSPGGYYGLDYLEW